MYICSFRRHLPQLASTLRCKECRLRFLPTVRESRTAVRGKPRIGGQYPDDPTLPPHSVMCATRVLGDAARPPGAVDASIFPSMGEEGNSTFCCGHRHGGEPEWGLRRSRHGSGPQIGRARAAALRASAHGCVMTGMIRRRQTASEGGSANGRPDAPARRPLGSHPAVSGQEQRAAIEPAAHPLPRSGSDPRRHPKRTLRLRTRSRSCSSGSAR